MYITTEKNEKSKVVINSTGNSSGFYIGTCEVLNGWWTKYCMTFSTRNGLRGFWRLGLLVRYGIVSSAAYGYWRLCHQRKDSLFHASEVSLLCCEPYPTYPSTCTHLTKHHLSKPTNLPRRNVCTSSETLDRPKPPKPYPKPQTPSPKQSARRPYSLQETLKTLNPKPFHRNLAKPDKPIVPLRKKKQA